jgi:Domain of unknown function (DUF4126)
MLEILLAVLSASAAAGMRVALPLLVIGLLYGGSLWAQIPILSTISPPILLGVLVSWALLELFASTDRLGQRVLQVVQLFCSPILGGIMGIAIAQAADLPMTVVNVLGVVGSLLALVLQLVQVGWFYRVGTIPIWVTLVQDVICVALVVFAFGGAPTQGGILALLLLWFAIRNAKSWQTWYRQQSPHPHRSRPREGKQSPD